MGKRKGTKYYQRQLTIGRKPDGSLIRKTIYGSTKAEMERKYAEAKSQLDKGIFISDDKRTFEETAALWMKHVGSQKNPLTLRNYVFSIKRLNEAFGKMKIKELKSYHLMDIISKMNEDGLSTRTMHHVKISANQIMNFAIDNDMLYRNVFRNIKVPSHEPMKRRALEPEEIALIESTWSGHRMGLHAMIMLYCGLRKGEVLALMWNDIDFDKHILKVTKSVTYENNQPELKAPKSKAGIREVPIPDVLYDILKGQQPTSIYVSPNPEGGIMSKEGSKKAWDSYMNYLNNCAGGQEASRSRPRKQVIERFTQHNLRHTYATMLYEANVDVKSAQKFLGHASLQMTLGVYTHLSKDKEQESVDKLNEFFNKKVAEPEQVTSEGETVKAEMEMAF